MFETNEDLALDDDDDFLNLAFDKEQETFSNTIKPRYTSLESSQQRQPCYPVEAREQVSLTKTSLGASGSIPGRNFSAIPTSQPNGFELPTDKTFHFNKENKRKLVLSPPTTKKRRERKFPGPAGLLPDRKSTGGTPLKLDYVLEADKYPSNPEPEDICSQGRCSGSVLEEEPWQNLLQDLGADRRILEEVNVASVKRKAAAKCFSGRKVPFLAAVLHHLDVSSPDPCVILRDTTGEIHGTLHREVWEQFAGELVVGSVLVVRSVGLLSTGVSSRRHYLNITANNLVTIYSARPDKTIKSCLHPFTPQDFSQTIQNWRSLVSPSHGVGSPASVGSPLLFNTSLSSPLNNNTIQRSATPSANRGCVPNRPDFVRTPQGPNLRHPVPRAMGFPGNSPRSSPPIRALGKNLAHLFSPSASQGVSNVPLIVPNVCRPKLFPTQSVTNPNVNNRPTTSSYMSSSTKPSLHLQHSEPPPSSNKRFEFNPVYPQQKKFNNEVFPQTNSDRQSSIGSNVLSASARANRDTTTSDVNHGPKVILSPSSQLTAEEQSVVESVFEGIDVDNLFDDDF